MNFDDSTTNFSDKLKYYTKVSLEKFFSILPQDASYWIAAFITGIAAVTYAGLIQFAEESCQRLFGSNPYLMFLSTPLCFLLGAWMVHRISPEAKGSGIPQVMAAISVMDRQNRINPKMERLLEIKTALVKVVSSFFCVLGGGAVGREGPTLQISACIFHFICTKSEKYFNRPSKQFGLVAGGAAGIAAAFNTPLGGLVYAIEELTTSHFNRFKTSLISGVIISGMVSQWLLGSYLYIGYPRLPKIEFATTMQTAFVGVLTGLAGALFGKVLYKLGIKISGFKNPKSYVILALGSGLLMATLTVFADSRSMGPGREVVIHLLTGKESTQDFLLVLSRFFSPILSYVSGCAGGIFAPSLAAGGSMGGYIAGILNPDAKNLFILVGMIGFLTGVTRAPFTSFVLILEMTDRHTALLPMMLAALTASMVSKFVDSKSFYELNKDNYLPFKKP